METAGKAEPRPGTRLPIWVGDLRSDRERGPIRDGGRAEGRFRAVARSDRYCWGDTEAGGCAGWVVVCRALSGDIHRVKHSAAVSINFIDFAAWVWQGRASSKVAQSGCLGLALPVPQGLLIPAPGSVATYLCVWGKYYLSTQGVASDFWPRKHTVNYSQILGVGFQILCWVLALCLRAEFLPRLRARRIAEADLAFYSNLWQNVLSKKARLFYFLWASLKKTQTRKLWAEVHLKVHFFILHCCLIYAHLKVQVIPKGCSERARLHCLLLKYLILLRCLMAGLSDC